MSPDKYQQLIVRRAVKAAEKQKSRTREDLDLETIRNLKVATASPFSRIFIGLIGSVLLVSMIYLQITDGFSWLIALIACFGIYFIVVAIRGRKKRISEIENAIDFIDLGGSLVELIVDNLDVDIDI